MPRTVPGLIIPAASIGLSDGQATFGDSIPLHGSCSPDSSVQILIESEWVDTRSKASRRAPWTGRQMVPRLPSTSGLMSATL
jgi:hypothetical protein